MTRVRCIDLGNLEIDRPLTVLPRTRGYVHRDLIAVVQGVGMTEAGELVRNLPTFATSTDPHIWVTNDPAELLVLMVAALGRSPLFNYQITSSQETRATGGPVMRHDRLTRFGYEHEGRRHQAMHTVWTPGEMARDPSSCIMGVTHRELMTFAYDVRGWCEENDLPLPTSFGGIASALLRDKRFYPSPRGRVPKATNERCRPFLPGVHSDLLADAGPTYDAVALDQRTAYHRAAQTTPMPDSTTLYARGYFGTPETAPIWAERGTPLYDRTVSQPGLVAVRGTLPSTRKRRIILPALVRPPENRVGVVYLWTNEVTTAESMGLVVEGITAAWTSTVPDEGMPRYGAWAEAQVNAASAYRKRWLKPLLHMTYGLLAARARDLSIGTRNGRGRPSMYVLGAGHEFPVREAHLGAHSPNTTNVPALGTLQAEIRARTIRFANDLMDAGADVLHVHADGLHVAGNLPLIPEGWRLEARTRLTYLDGVSWMSAEDDCLPGRDSQVRAKTIRENVARTGRWSPTPDRWAAKLKGIRHRRAIR